MRLLVVLFVLLIFPSCQNRTVQKLVKAKPAPISRFLDQRLNMVNMRNRLPVHYMWVNNDPKARAVLDRCTEIFVAPVELSYLRPVSKPVAKWEVRQGWITVKEREMAHELRRRFILALANSPAPRFRVVERPGPKTVILALAMTELNPTSVKGNAVKFAAKFAVGPLSGLLGVFVKGNIAIEGKILLPGKRPPDSFLQFADNEKDKMTFYNVRDFQPNAHALVAIDEWARQFEEFTRTSGFHQVKESSFITLKPW